MGKLLDEFDNNNISLRLFISQEIINYRETHNKMSQGQFAALSGLTKTSISNLENEYMLCRSIRRSSVEAIERLIEFDTPSITKMVEENGEKRRETGEEKKIRISNHLKQKFNEVLEYKNNIIKIKKEAKNEIKLQEEILKSLHRLKNNVNTMSIYERGIKKCKKCKKDFPLAEFYKNKLVKNGLYSKCKKCFDEYAKKMAGK